MINRQLFRGSMTPSRFPLDFSSFLNPGDLIIHHVADGIASSNPGGENLLEVTFFERLQMCKIKLFRCDYTRVRGKSIN